MQLQMQTEYVFQKPPRFSRLANRIKHTYQYDTAFWRIAIAGPWGAGLFAFVLLALGVPTGSGTFFDILLFTTAGTFSFFVLGNIVAILLALIGLRIPRLFIGTVLFDLIAVFLIFYLDDVELVIAAIVSVIVTLGGILTGLVIGLLASRGISSRIKLGLVVLLALLVLSTIMWPKDQSASQSEHQLTSSVTPINAVSPAEPGSYSVDYFTYGSGEDPRQTEFGRHVDLLSESVDASEYITKWSKLRTLFWGYDEKSLPLNGRVWMPQGSGPFPIVLIVHGNHLMEDYSDDGYAYLGKLLASRGFITVSVDENFLNYSIWTGIPNNDMKVRAWVLLKHLEQIDQFASSPDNPFYEKIDYEQVALIGHSRGGQAVAMAADADQWFSTDDTLGEFRKFHIQAVAAIAPTDKKVDEKQTKLHDVNYLTLQGAQDGDVSDFDGERQYVRTTFSSGSANFKSTLYISNANHSQFNSGWGDRDIAYPLGILLSKKDMLSAPEQRSISKVYISAFLEATLHGEQQYIPLFRDYRNGLKWLPETSYYNRFESGEFTSWASFDEDTNRVSLPGAGKATGTDLIWLEEEYKNRHNSNKGTRGIVLSWESKESTDPSYSLSWEQGAKAPRSGEASILAFSLSNRSFELTEEKTAEESLIGPFEIEVEIQDTSGVSVRLPLSSFMAVPSLPETNFTLHPWLDQRLSDGKYKHPTETVFQTFQLPLSEYTSVNPKLDLTSIQKLTFYMGDGRGKIMLDDIGVY